MQRLQEEQDSKDLKVKIMQQANLMQYDDDFDEEAEQMNKRQKYKVDLVQPSNPNKSSLVMEEIQPIKPKPEHTGTLEESDDSEDIDAMARFVEGQDIELVKDHSSLIQDDEKLLKIRQKKKQEEESKKLEKERIQAKKQD